ALEFTQAARTRTRRRNDGSDRGTFRQSSDFHREARQGREVATVPRGADAGAPGSDRSGLLPREIGGGGVAGGRPSGEHGKDAHVLRAQETGRVVQNGGN